MELIDDLYSLIATSQQFSTQNRALRLRISFPTGISDQVLLPQRVTGGESICGGLDYTIQCVSATIDLPLKSFIGLAAELQFVTDTGDLHAVCGLVAEAASGQSDGGLATYQLVLRDAFSSVLALGANTRVFIDKNELDIAAIVLAGWRERSPLLAAAFDYKFSLELAGHQFPPRAFTRQDNESDAAFLTRLFKRRGIAWYVRPGRAMPTEDDDKPNGAPVHTLVMFDEQLRLRRNVAGTVRYHRADATEEHDSVTGWSAVRTLGKGSLTRFSWDYANPLGTHFMQANARSRQDQGQRGNRIALDINDFRIDPPHAGDSNADHLDLLSARMASHDFAAKTFHAEGTVRDLRVAEWITLEGHPEIDRHVDDAGRQFIVTAFRLSARNNLPKALNGRIDRLFMRNRWQGEGDALLADLDAQPFKIQFTCTRRSIRIAAPFDPRVDVPRARMHSAIVVGPEGEAVHCDAMGRIKIRFPGLRAADHTHASGAGTSDTDADSAWVRLASPWAGNGPGSFNQFGAVFLPRPGSEVLVAYIDDDPDRPIIVGQLYNQSGMPAALSSAGALPGNRYQAGLRSREVHGTRGNQLRFDDTAGQISAQLASDHGTTELNLGWLSTPRAGGQGEARGEGAELRSDEAIALRAAKGLLFSAWKRIDGAGAGKQLARDDFASLLRDCGELFSTLGKYAQEHNALGLDAKAQDALTLAFTHWENGSNTAPGAAGGGAPVIGITAPGGISFATSQAIVSYAATSIDTVAQQHLQMTAGQRFNLNAGKGISLFAHHDGISAIAHNGKLLLQSQHDDTEINAAKNCKVTASEGKVTVMAQQIELIVEDGSFIKIGDGGITFGSKSPLKFRAPDFDFAGPTTMATAFPSFGSGATDLQFVAKYYPQVDGGLPAADLAHKIANSVGEKLDAKTDPAGKSSLLKSDAMHIADIDIRDIDDAAPAQ